MKNRKQKGFTLIELIVVISIILIFAGFLIPKFSGYQVKAKETKAINTAKQIQNAAMSSYSEMDGKFDNVKVEDTITSLTGAESVTAAADTDGKKVTVSFKSDTDNYSVVISDGSSGFKVYKGEGTANQIYPK
jgi:type IV pilus assembly protein PilA